jgi:HEAT repeat protein
MARLSLRPQRLAAKAAESPELREALIALLQRENVIVDNPGPASLSEAEMIEFRLDVVSVVASMKVAGTIAALSPWVSVGGRAAVALEQFGEAAVPHLVPLIQHRDQFRRAGAARVLGRIAARNMELRVSAPAMEAIKQALLLATKHQEDFILRLIGVRGLSSFSGEDVRTAMERIASEDRTSVVREAAEKWLRDHPRTQ